MKYLSVCSGVEAASIAWEKLGWTPVGFSEIEPFPSAVLAHRFPGVKNYGDLTKYKEWPLKAGDIDLLVGGTPCQAFSVAGLRKGLEDPRGNLTLTFLGLVNHLRPKYVLWENVPGVLSDKTGAFYQFLDGLSDLGYLVDFDICDAQFFGVAQRRRRVFVCAQDLGSLLCKTTTTSASITAKLLLETLHGILEDQASTAFSSVRARLDSVALTRDGARRRMQLLSQYGNDESVCHMLRSNCIALSQLALVESPSSVMENGAEAGRHSCMQGDLFASFAIMRRSTNTEPSWKSFSDDLYAAMKSCITSTPTSTTTDQIILFSSHALSIAQRIARLNQSSLIFCEAASSALTFIERSMSYARLASKELHRGMEWVQYWRDFQREAENLVQPLAHLGDGADPAKILFEPESVRGDSAKGRQKRKSSSPDAGTGTPSGGAFRMTAFGQYENDGTASTLKQRDYKDATDLVAFNISPTFGQGSALQAAPTDIANAVTVTVTEHARSTDRGTRVVTDTIGALCARDYKGVGSQYVNEGKCVAVAQPPMAVRRLTPVECERLQGFPTVTESVRLTVCFDPTRKNVRVAVKCRKWHGNVSSADDVVYPHNVELAAQGLSANLAVPETLAVLVVRQNSATVHLALPKTEKWNCSAKSAEQSSAYLLLTGAEDTAQELARLVHALGVEAAHGKVESRLHSDSSSLDVSGSQSVASYGQDTADFVVDVTLDQNSDTFTTFALGRTFPKVVLTRATLCCSVLRVIAGCIPDTTLPASFSIDLMVESEWTAIPWKGKPASECPDGPRYKAMGNSMAVPVMRWIGERLDRVVREGK